MNFIPNSTAFNNRKRQLLLTIYQLFFFQVYLNKPNIEWNVSVMFSYMPAHFKIVDRCESFSRRLQNINRLLKFKAFAGGLALMTDRFFSRKPYLPWQLNKYIVFMRHQPSKMLVSFWEV